MKTKLQLFKCFFSALLIASFLTSNAQLSNVTNGFVGNTFSGDNNQWVQNYANELDVASDGTMVTASEWDEAGRCIGIFKDGQPVALVKEYDGAGGHNCWGWGTASKAAAVDNNYLYVNNCDGDILRFNRLNGYSYVDKVNTGVAEGMTCSNGYLYLITTAGEVQKRSVSTLSKITLKFTIMGAYDLAVDASGNIWVLTTNKEVLKYNASGANTGTKIAAQTGWEPSAVNYDAYNDLLLVPDNGSRRQVIKFNTSGTQVGTFGDLGGISSGTKGIVGDKRFWDISGCGTDASGNVYVALNENCVSLRKFNSSGVKQWEVLGTMFTDIASIDPASDGTEIYSVSEHMSFNYSTQQWGLTSITCDRIGNPTDPRNDVTGTIISSALMRRVNGNLIMFTTGMYADGYDVYRFDGEIAVKTQGIWSLGWSGLPDKNGNIWYESGGRIKKIPLTGFSGSTPVFGTAVDVTTSLPSPMTAVERVEYDADRDVMFIAGWTTSNPNTNNDWGLIGSTIARYPNWSTGNRTASNTAVMPKDIGGYYPKAMSVANDYVFVGGSRDRGDLYVYNSNNLLIVGNIYTPDNMGEVGWLDIPNAVQAFKKSNGQYLVLVEDNSKGKNILYQWCPTGNCTSSTVSVTGVTMSPTTASVAVNATTQLTATVAPSDATNKTVTWSSSNTAIASVNSSGLVTANAAGTATITVTTQDGNKLATCAISITQTTGSIHIEAESYTSLSCGGTKDGDGGVIVGWLDPGCYLLYDVNIPISGNTSFVVRAATGNTGAQVILKNSSGTVLSTANITNSGWGTFNTITVNATGLTAGAQTLRLEVAGAGFDFNWWELLGSASTDHTYNFSGINAANTDYEVFLCDVDVFPFAGSTANRNSMVEATDAQYSNVSAIDGAELLTVNPGSGDEMFVWVEMKITEAVSAISQIDFTYNGYTNGSTSTHRIYVLKAGQAWQTSASWVQVGSNQSFPASNTTMTRSITSNIADYIDAYGNIIWGIYETTSNQPEHVNYIGMTVTYNSLKSAEIVNSTNNENLNNTIQPSVNVFPNPVKNSNMHIQLKGYEAMDNLDINIIDIYGRIVYNESIQLNRGDQTIDLNNESFATKGMYFLQLLNTTHGSKQIVKLLVE